MYNYDPQLAQRVWQRVQGNAPTAEPLPPLFPLLHTALTDAALCLRLAGQHNGPQSTLLRQVARRKQTHAACLAGILRMNGEASPVSPAPIWKGTPQAALRYCLGNTLRCAEQYRQWETQPEYGVVFGALAQQEIQLAQKLLQFCGNLP